MPSRSSRAVRVIVVACAWVVQPLLRKLSRRPYLRVRGGVTRLVCREEALAGLAVGHPWRMTTWLDVKRSQWEPDFIRVDRIAWLFEEMERLGNPPLALPVQEVFFLIQTAVNNMSLDGGHDGAGSEVWLWIVEEEHREVARKTLLSWNRTVALGAQLPPIECVSVREFLSEYVS